MSDAKSPDENDLDRISILTLPDGVDGIGFRSIKTGYPGGGKSSDFESAAGIPGTNYVLLSESSDNGAGPDRIGTVDKNGLNLDAEFPTIATLDGFKIKSVAVREVDGQKTLFIGTDDENFGGELRQIIIPQ